MKNVAVFGAGRIGRIHASNLAALPGVKLKYVSDPMAQPAAELAQRFSAQVATIEDVFSDKSVDAVAICSSTDTHSDLITRAAKAGKHIFCEKPVDLSVSRAQACAETVRVAGVACMTVAEQSLSSRPNRTPSEAAARLLVHAPS